MREKLLTAGEVLDAARGCMKETSARGSAIRAVTFRVNSDTPISFMSELGMLADAYGFAARVGGTDRDATVVWIINQRP